MSKYDNINQMVDTILEQSVAPVGVETKEVPKCPTGYRW